jgi:hypothetical protein
MKTIYFLFVLLLIFSKNVCAKEFNSDEELIQSISKNILEAKILFFGEAHANFYAHEHYVPLIQSIEAVDPSYNCFAIEAPHDLQDNLNDLIQNKITREDYLETYADKIGAVLSPAAFQAKLLGMKGWFDIISTFGQPDINFFDIDLETSSSAHSATQTVESVDLRNAYMASQLNYLLTNGSCDKIISLNGAQHLGVEGSSGLPAMIATATFSIALYSLGTQSQKSIEDAVKYGRHTLHEKIVQVIYDPDHESKVILK